MIRRRSVLELLWGGPLNQDRPIPVTLCLKPSSEYPMPSENVPSFSTPPVTTPAPPKAPPASAAPASAAKVTASGSVPKKTRTLAEVATGQVTGTTSLKDQITTLGKNIAANALSRIGNSVNLLPEDAALFEECAERVAACQIQSIGADADTVESLTWQMNASFAAMQNLELGVAVASRNAILGAANDVMTAALQTALSITMNALTGGTASAVSALVGAVGAAAKK